MRNAIGLISLGVAGGILPTGAAGMAHVAPVVGGAVAALALLVGACLAAPALRRRRVADSGRAFRRQLLGTRLEHLDRD